MTRLISGSCHLLIWVYNLGHSVPSHIKCFTALSTPWTLDSLTRCDDIRHQNWRHWAQILMSSILLAQIKLPHQRFGAFDSSPVIAETHRWLPVLAVLLHKCLNELGKGIFTLRNDHHVQWFDHQLYEKKTWHSLNSKYNFQAKALAWKYNYSTDLNINSEHFELL